MKSTCAISVFVLNLIAICICDSYNCLLNFSHYVGMGTPFLNLIFTTEASEIHSCLMNAVSCFSLNHVHAGLSSLFKIWVSHVCFCIYPKLKPIRVKYSQRNNVPVHLALAHSNTNIKDMKFHDINNCVY